MLISSVRRDYIIVLDKLTLNSLINDHSYLTHICSQTPWLMKQLQLCWSLTYPVLVHLVQ